MSHDELCVQHWQRQHRMVQGQNMDVVERERERLFCLTWCRRLSGDAVMRPTSLVTTRSVCAVSVLWYVPCHNSDVNVLTTWEKLGWKQHLTEEILKSNSMWAKRWHSFPVLTIAMSHHTTQEHNKHQTWSSRTPPRDIGWTLLALTHRSIFRANHVHMLGGSTVFPTPPHHVPKWPASNNMWGEGWGSERWRGQKFRAFFPLPPSLFLYLSGVFSSPFFFFSGCRVKPWRP